MSRKKADPNADELIHLPPMLKGKGRYQMQSFSTDRGAWRPMEDGPAARVWRRRDTALEAIAKCLAWSSIDLAEARCIPTMQVVDLDAGTVIWRSRSYKDKGAGDPIDHPDLERARELARAVWAGSPGDDTPDGNGAPENTQEALF